MVYRARSLYMVISDDLHPWNDDSCMAIDSTFVAARRTSPKPTITSIATDNDGQHYTLFPNPNDGKIVLQQYVADGDPVKTDIYDIVGRVIYSESLTFDNKLSHLQISNVPPGMYLLQVTDSKKRIFKFKFVIQK